MVECVGVRFQLEIEALDWTTADDSKEKIGPWTMNWVQEWQDAEKTIHPESTATTPQAILKLKKVTLTPSSTKLDYTADFKKSLSFDYQIGDLQADKAKSEKSNSQTEEMKSEQTEGHESKPVGDEMYSC